MATKKSSSTKSSSSKKSKSSSPRTSPGTLDVSKDMSCDIRQINNGFIVRESGYVGKGKNQQWKTNEYFTPKNPISGVKLPALTIGKKNK